MTAQHFLLIYAYCMVLYVNSFYADFCKEKFFGSAFVLMNIPWVTKATFFAPSHF